MDNRNRYIEHLYAEEQIGAEIYLFCLDNNIETIDEVECFLEENKSEILNKQLFDSLKSLCQPINSHETDKIDDDIIVSNERTMDDELTNYIRLYNRYKSEYSIRTQNVLNRLEDYYDFPSKEFFDFLLFNKSPLCTFKKLKNSGVKTVGELISLSENIIEDIGNSCHCEEMVTITDESSENDGDLNVSIAHGELLDIALTKLLHNVSVRSKKAIVKLRSECSDFNDFFNIISSPHFDIIGQKNVGKGCIADFHHVINSLVGTIKQLQKEDCSNITRLFLLESRFELTEQQAKLVDAKVPRDVEFPIFAIIKLLIDNNERISVISNNLINIYENQVVIDRDEVAAILGISSERVRQLRNTYLDEILGWLKKWNNQYSSIWNQYNVCYAVDYEDRFIEDINTTEGVNFNPNFIYTALHLIRPNDTAIIGDYKQALLSKTDKEYKVHIVPQILNTTFDFDNLLCDLRTRIHEKVYETYTININEYILSFFRDSITFEIIPDIIDVCRKLMFKNFDIIVQDDIFSIEQNATKNIPDILEDIMRTNNRIMTLDELYQEIESLYPGITKDRNSLRGSILRNPNIIAVSRSSSYTLKEWKNTELRGGTIRDLAFDFLDTSNYPQSIECIAEYILSFRPHTNVDSIYANLFSDQTKRFSLYQNNGNRVIGLSHKEYPLEWELIEFNDTTKRKSFDESINDFEQFILENNRYPFSSGNQEEERLSRFIGVQNAKFKKGESSNEEREKLIELETKYGHLKISKRDYLWNLKFTELEHFILSKNRLPKRSTEFELYNWFYDQTRGKLNDEQQAKMIRIKSMIEHV